jgi:molybdopterin-guanine dinucleotide biosynthesis protein A
MDCVVLAGGRIEESDPLFAITGGKPKALIELGGLTLLERVLGALLESRFVDDIVVVGIENNAVEIAPDRSITWLPDQGTLVANALSGLRWAQNRRSSSAMVMFCTADLPAIRGELVDDFVESCKPLDHAAYKAFVTRQTLDDRYPGVDRTYSKIDGLDVAGCDLVIARAGLADSERSLWDAIANARKQPWKIARLVGYRLLITLLLGRLTTAQVEKAASRVLGSPAKLLISSHAELAMDIDKPSHVKILKKEFEG